LFARPHKFIIIIIIIFILNTIIILIIIIIFIIIIIVIILIVITLFLLPPFIAEPAALGRFHFVTIVTEEFISISRKGIVLITAFWNSFFVEGFVAVIAEYPRFRCDNFMTTGAKKSQLQFS
jgi:hypothetical protein